MRPDRYSFTSVNVGECTRSVIPRPLAKPFAYCVFPAPRSPTRPRTRPGCAVLPNAAAMRKVSSGLFEVSVTMLRNFPHPGVVPDAETRLRSDFPDATELRFWKVLLPAVDNGDRVRGRDGEEQFVILAIGQGGQKRRFGGRFRFRFQFGGAT